MFLEPIVESSFPETRDIGVSTYLRVCACVPISLYYAHVCVFIVYLRSMYVHLHTRRLYPLCDISKRTLLLRKENTCRYEMPYFPFYSFA